MAPGSTLPAPRCYLVTGVAGFIASKVAEMLLAEGHTVVGVDNLNDYYDVRLKDYRLTKLLGGSYSLLGSDPKRSVYSQKPETGNLKPEGSDPKASLSSPSGFRFQVSGFSNNKFTFHHLDIENLPALEALFSAHRFDAVFNLAARAGVRYSLEFPDLYRRTNVLGEENVLKCQVKYGVKKHVLASSSSVYAGCPMPFVEDAVLGKMQSPYAETKRQAELLALEYHQKHGIDVTALRYFTVFGPAGRPDMAPFRFIKWIAEGTPITLYGDGTQARDFTYVDDIARGTVLAGRLFGGQLREEKPETGNLKPEESNPDSDSKPQTPGLNSASSTSGFRFQVSGFPGGLQPGYDVINLGGGNNPLTITAMIAMIEKALGKKAVINSQPLSAADMKATWADITKAGRLQGWKPDVTPHEGFGRTVDWHRQNAEWLKDIRV
jgi:UDP-glucuronate 4-epimerase